MPVVLHRNELDEHKRRSATLALPFADEMLDAGEHFGQSATHPVFGIRVLIRTINRNDHGIDSRRHGAFCGLLGKKVAVGAGRHKDSFGFGVFNEPDELIIDKRFALLIQ